MLFVNKNVDNFYKGLEKANESRDKLTKEEYDMELKKLIFNYLRDSLGIDTWYLIKVES
jgi:hypothetical protein